MLRRLNLLPLHLWLEVKEDLRGGGILLPTSRFRIAIQSQTQRSQELARRRR